MTREEAIKYLGWLKNETRIIEYRLAISMAVAAILEQEQRRWIPVTERLPEKQGKFICTYKFNSNSEMQFVGVLEYYASCQYPHWQHESAGVIVTHWMPMPEPPKEEREC